MNPSPSPPQPPNPIETSLVGMVENTDRIAQAFERHDQETAADRAILLSDVHRISQTLKAELHKQNLLLTEILARLNHLTLND